MKNMLKCSSLIRVAVIIVVMAFMAAQVTDTYAGGWSNYGLKRIIKKIHACNRPNCEQCNPDGNTDNCSEVCGEIKPIVEEINSKVDQIDCGDGQGNGECPTCCDAWDKVITDANDRFELVMGGAGVLDKETCLVWEQSPDTTSMNWASALNQCFRSEVGGRGGWRLPTIEELTSLKDTVNTNPALPSGHPFDPNAVQLAGYWSSTTIGYAIAFVWVVGFNNGGLTGTNKENDNSPYTWCVRGGQSHESY